MRRALDWMLSEGDRSPDRIADRVRARPTPAELIAVASIVVILVASARYPGHGIDWEIFAGAADGDFTSDYGLDYYYAYWLLPLFDLFALPGVLVGGVIWSIANVVGVWFAARVFGARPVVVLAAWLTISGFYTGTITGLAVGALAALWWALHRERWIVVGAMSLLAVAKPQWGLPIAAMMVLHRRPPLRAWPQMAVVPAPVVAASFWAYGFWPADIVDRATANPPVGNGSLWSLLGPVVLLLWAGALLPMDDRRRLSVIAALSVMAVPYVQQYDYVVLWLLAGDGLGLLSYAGGPIEMLLGERVSIVAQMLLPVGAYAWLVGEPLRRAIAGRREHRAMPVSGRRQTAG